MQGFSQNKGWKLLIREEDIRQEYIYPAGIGQAYCLYTLAAQRPPIPKQLAGTHPHTKHIAAEREGYGQTQKWQK